MAVLPNGYNVQVKQVTSQGSKNIYPITKAKDVIFASGNTLEEALAGLGVNAVKQSQIGVATPNVVEGYLDGTTFYSNSEKTDAVTLVEGTVYKDKGDNDTLYMYDGENLTEIEIVEKGVASLDTNGKVPAAQLPSYVDDVVEGYLKTADGKFYENYTADPEAWTTEITGEGSKIYVDLTTKKTYRWSGSAFVEISESLALGTTSSTAFAGDTGLIAYRHAMNLDTSTGEAETNHNPHGLTASDINGLYGVGEEVALKSTLVSASTNQAGGTNGLFRATDYEKFNQMQQIIISDTATGASFAGGNGIWLEIVDDETSGS